VTARRLLVLGTLVAATSGLGLFHQVQDIDPAQYASVARGVAATGRWLDLEDARGPFINKPPLMIWTQALAMKGLPDLSAAARLPALAFGALALVALFLCGRALFDEKTAALAVALLAATPAFQLMIADPKVDMPLVAFTTASVWAFVRGGRYVWLGWLCAALAVLTKGPIGAVLVACALLPEALRLYRVRDARPLAGLALVAAVASPFYLALGANHGGRAVAFLLWDSGPGRLFDSTVVHDGTTPAFFLHTGAWALAPLSPVLVLALARRALAFARNRTLPADPQRAVMWWFALPFLIISFSSIKMPQYVYWVGPPAALIAAREALSWKENARAAWAWPAVTGLAVLGVSCVLLLACFPAAPWVLPAWSVVCVAGTVLAARLSGPGGAAAAAMGAFFLLFHGHLHGALLAYQAGEPLGRAVRAADPQGTMLPYVGASAQYSAGLYAERSVCDADEPRLRELVLRGDTHTAVVTDEQAAALITVGWKLEPLARAPSFRTSVPSWKFLDASTRDGTLTWLSAVRVTPPGSP
jgi:4-amino-4-deoxy-L-arabinose transferase-like glycosyltransferase